MSSRLQQYRKTWYMLLYNIQANITHLEPFTMYSASNLNIAQLPEQISNVTDGKLLWFSQTISLYCRFLLVQQNKSRTKIGTSRFGCTYRTTTVSPKELVSLCAVGKWRLLLGVAANKLIIISSKSAVIRERQTD